LTGPGGDKNPLFKKVSVTFSENGESPVRDCDDEGREAGEELAAA